MDKQESNYLANTKLIDMKYITNQTGLTDKWFYKLIQLNQFPKPIKLGRSSRWLESDFNNWLLDKINQSKLPN